MGVMCTRSNEREVKCYRKLNFFSILIVCGYDPFFKSCYVFQIMPPYRANTRNTKKTPPI